MIGNWLRLLSERMVSANSKPFMKVDGKADGSPVTEADLAADRIIAAGLAQLAPKIPSLSEERAASVELPCESSFFLIDPLDGTKEFVAGRDEFTVNLALVTHVPAPRMRHICPSVQETIVS